MKLGPKAMEALRAEVPGTLQPEEELVILGAIALAGTARIAQERVKDLRAFFAERFLQDARELPKRYGAAGQCGDDWEKTAKEFGADLIYEVGEGGFLSALWKAAEVSDVGMSINFRKVPIRQETIEICEVFDVNPYRLLSENCYLIGMKSADSFVQEMKRRGAMAEIIGQTNSGKDRLLYSGDSARYLDKPTKDELWKVVEPCQD